MSEFEPAVELANVVGRLLDGGNTKKKKSNSVPNRADNPKRRVTVGKYDIEYGHNPHTGHPEAWAESSANHNWGNSYASTMQEDGSISHGSRGTNPVPAKYARAHIEKTLRKMKKGK